MITAEGTVDTKYGEKVKLSSDYEDKNAIKSLPWEAAHPSWNSDGKYWTVDYCPEIVDYLDAIGTKNLDWLRDDFEEERKDAENFFELSQAEDSDFDVPAPEGLEYYDFQRAGIEYAAKKFEGGEDGVLIADQMGLGKTIQAIGAMNHLGTDTAIVVCPASLKENWRRELEKWLVRDLDVEIYRDDLPDADVVVVNYALLSTREGIAEKLNSLGAGMLILDESHYIKNKDAKRTERARDLEVDKRIFLTGTPIKNRPIELWTQLNELTSAFDFWSYAKRYANATKGRFGWDMTGASNLDELQQRLRSEVMVRRRKEDVLEDLPEKMRQLIPLPKNGLADLVEKEQSAYETHREQIAEAKREVAHAKVSDDEDAYEAAIEKLKAARDHAFENLAEIRKQIADGKVDHVVEHVESVLESEDKVVVFAHHKDVICRLEQEFGDEAVTLTGDTPSGDRQEAVDRFQNDDSVRVFIGSIHAAGTGLTLTAASHVVFAELDWTPSVNRQCEDRCHRIGQEESVQVQYLVVDGSLESRIARMNVQKQKNIDKAMDEDTDADFYGKDEVDFSFVPTGEDEEIEGSVSGTQKEEIADTTAGQKEAILDGLKQLSAMCDGAQAEDGMGFNKLDTEFGHALAERMRLTDRQAHYGLKLVTKYGGQLDTGLVETAKGE
jgi:SWI/SNF-related matrix-associated actin-dependent regulator 1 of chromatin subfamily A